MNFEDMLYVVSQRSGLSTDQVNEKISAKKSEFPGISDEGILKILAKELGISLMQQQELKIGNIMPNMFNITFVGKITQVQPVREFNKDGRSGKVRNMVLEDETGTVRIPLWNDEVEKYDFKPGDIIRAENIRTRKDNFGNAEARIGYGGRLIKTFGEIKTRSEKDSLENLQEFDRINLEATLLHIFERQMVFTFCPECRTKVVGNYCQTHGDVVPNKSLILSALLDDGKSSINAVFFNDVAEVILDKKADDVEAILREKEVGAFIADSGLIAKKFKIAGLIRRNNFTNDLELRVSSAQPV